MDAQSQTTTPSGAKRHFNWWRFVLWPFVVLVVYVLSMGPVAMMLEKGCISPRNKWLMIYAPADFIYFRTPLHRPLGMYLHLWAPAKFNKYGELY